MSLFNITKKTKPAKTQGYKGVGYYMDEYDHIVYVVGKAPKEARHWSGLNYAGWELKFEGTGNKTYNWWQKHWFKKDVDKFTYIGTERPDLMVSADLPESVYNELVEQGVIKGSKSCIAR